VDLLQMKGQLVAWIQEKVSAAGADGTVIGISGGIDSAVVAALCQLAFPDNNLGVIMPCQSDPADAGLARELAESLGIKFVETDLSTTYQTLLAALNTDDTTRLAKANIKPRLRMTTLYYYAARHNYLVAGTGNRSEIFTGYFTKYGDGGVDMEPIGGLLKSQVRDLAKLLGVPERIITRPPTAGLWEGQTDEDELEISYEQLDKYIISGEGSDKVKEVTRRLHQSSEHKRHMPPVPEF